MSALPAGSPAQAPTRRRWLREPLLHFLLAGLALFLVYRALHPAASTEASNRITVTEDDLRQMTIALRAQGRPAPTPEQIRSLVESRVREEVLFREALALGLEKNDAIVKRRLAQKMESSPRNSPRSATPAGRAESLVRRRARSALPAPRASFSQVYFSPDRRGARRATMQRGRSRSSPASPRIRSSPHSSPIRSCSRAPMPTGRSNRSPAYSDRSSRSALFGLKPGAWQGPIESGYGWHLVWIDSLTPSRAPAFEEVEAEVRGVDRRAPRRSEAQGVRGDARALRGGAARIPREGRAGGAGMAPMSATRAAARWLSAFLVGFGALCRPRCPGA